MASTMAEVFRKYEIRGVWSGHQSPDLCQTFVEIISAHQNTHGPVAGMCYLEVLKESSPLLRQKWKKQKGNIRKKACDRRKKLQAATQGRGSDGQGICHRLKKVVHGQGRGHRLKKVVHHSGGHNFQKLVKGNLPRRRIVESDEEVSDQDDHCDGIQCSEPHGSMDSSLGEEDVVMERAPNPESIQERQRYSGDRDDPYPNPNVVDRRFNEGGRGIGEGIDVEVGDGRHEGGRGIGEGIDEEVGAGRHEGGRGIGEGIDEEVGAGRQLELALVREDASLELFEAMLRPHSEMKGKRWNLDYMCKTQTQWMIDQENLARDHARLLTLLPERLVRIDGDFYGTSDELIRGRIVRVDSNGSCYYKAMVDSLSYCGIVVPQAWTSHRLGKVGRFKEWLINEVSHRLDWVVPFQHGRNVERMAVDAIKAVLRKARDYEIQEWKVDSSGTKVLVTRVVKKTVSEELVKEVVKRHIDAGRTKYCLVEKKTLPIDECIDNLLKNMAPTEKCKVDEDVLCQMFFDYVRIKGVFVEDPIVSAMPYFGRVNVIIYFEKDGDLVLIPGASVLMADCRVAIILVMDIDIGHYDWFQWFTAGAQEED